MGQGRGMGDAEGKRERGRGEGRERREGDIVTFLNHSTRAHDKHPATRQFLVMFPMCLRAYLT